MGTGFSKKKKQAKMMQSQFQQMQEQMKDVVIVGSGGNGLVEITINGDNEVKNIKIKPECVDPEDIEGLEDLIKSAFNDAQAKLKKNTNMDLKSLGGGLSGIPGLSGFGL